MDSAPDPAPEKKDSEGIIRDNLGRWVKGTRGPNPLGAGAHKVSPTRLLAKHLEENPLDHAAIIAAVVARAKEGDGKALDIIFNRMDGMPAQRIHQVTEDVASAIKRELLEAEQNGD